MADQDDFVRRLIETFGFEPLPVEGGLYVQSYKSPETLPADALLPGMEGPHPFGTGIYYLLTDDPDSFSAMHRLPSDEVYHFYLGDPVEMLLLFPDGRSERVILGPEVLNGQKVQFVVPRGVWQGSHLRAGGEFALLGTTMGPGYANSDYVGGTRGELQRQYPPAADLIRQLTRE